MANKVLSMPLLGVNEVILEEENQEEAQPQEESQVKYVTQARKKRYGGLSRKHRTAASSAGVKEDTKNEHLDYRAPSDVTNKDTSFSSVFNSFMGFTKVAKNRREGSNRSGIERGVSSGTEYTDPRLSVLEAPPDAENIKASQFQSFDHFNKAMTAEAKVQENKEPGGDPSKKAIETDTETQRSQSKPVKEPTTASFSVLMKEKRAKVKEERREKVSSSQRRDLNTRTNCMAMPSCYVISKDCNSIYRRFFVGAHTNIAMALNATKIAKMLKSKRSSKQDKGTRRTETRRAVKVRYEEYHFSSLPRIKGSLDIFRFFPFIKKKWKKASPQPRRSVVSLVNQVNSNCVILKYQSDCKNYIDINPDFGWRRLLEEYKPIPPDRATGSHIIKDEAYAQQLYMYYRETKITTHAIGLADLAINIAYRAYVLGVAQGMIDPAGMPPYIHDAIKKQYDDWDTTGSCLRNYQEHCARGTMYRRSSLLGLFTASSIGQVHQSQAYRYSLSKSKRSFVWTIGQKKKQEGSAQNSTPMVKPSIYKFIPVPDYGWKLEEHSPFDRRFKDNYAQDKARSSFMALMYKIFQKSKCKGNNSSAYSNAILCKISAPHVNNRKVVVHADVGSIAMNISEQLYRLEVKQASRERLPKNTFGFQVLSQNVVVSPCGMKFKMVPEELILNTATLVHEMYITQPCLIL